MHSFYFRFKSACAVIFTAFFILFGSLLCAQTTYTWNGSTSTAWNNSANWTPGTGFPGSADNAIIVNAGNVPTLASNTQISNLTVTSGTLNLGGSTLTATGNHTFTAGTVQNGTVTAAAGGTSLFTATTFSSNCVVSITSSTITINGGTFNGTTTLVQNGAGTSTGTGGATFNGTTVIENAGSGNFRTNTGITFNGTTQLKVSSSGYLLLELTGANTYNGNVTMTITGTGNLRSCYNGATNFNGNILLENTGGGGLYFCEQATATATLANTKTISAGAAGISAGPLYLYRFTQTGSTAQSITTSGSAIVYINNSTTFNGNFSITGPDIYTSNATYNGTFTLTKNGGTSDNNQGGNTFASTATINNSSAGYWASANSVADIFNGDLYLNNTGTERIILAINSTGTQLNGNVIVTQSSTGQGISLGWNTSSGITMAATKNISVGSGGFTGGYLQLYNFTQNGSAASNLTLTGTSSFYFSGTTVLGGAISVTAPDIYVRGLTANAAATFTKTGGTSNHNNGVQNIFNSTLTINQQSNGGYFMVGYNSNDLFNDNITVSSTGSGGIYLGYSSGTGTPTLAATKTVSIGGAGFSAGFLYFGRFTQNGSAAMNLTMTGTNTALYFGNASVIGGNLTTSSPDIYFNGATFNGTVTSTKTGATSNAGSGGNTFNMASTFNNTGAGYLMFGNGTADTWNGDATFNNSGSERILIGWNAAGNQFNGNITLSNTGSGTGIDFCGNTTSTATLAATKTLSIGSSGFNTGYLILRRFTQNGNAAINLTLTGATTYFQINNASVIGGNITVTSPRILLDGATFNGTGTFNKTGSTGEWCAGGNTFNGDVTINHTGSGYFGFANANPDVYNGDLYVNNNGSERVIFANTSVGNQYNGNIILTQIGSSQGIAFGWSTTCAATLAATKTISIGGAGFNTGYLILRRFTQNGSAAMNLTLTGGTSTYFQIDNASVIGGNFTLTSPRILLNGATFSGAASFTKTGSTGEWSVGGNTFNADVTVNHTGSGYFGFANSNPDVYNGDLYANNNSTERIIFANLSVGNQYNGNIIVTQIGSSQGIAFGWSAGGTSTMAATKTISIGAAGFSAGYLQIARFTQLGSAAISLTTTGTSVMYLGPTAVFGGSFTAIAPDIWPQGATYNSAASFTKTGGTNNHNQGAQNIFNSTCTINQQSSGGYFMLGYNSNDLFNGDITVSSTGTGGINLGWVSGTGTPTLAATKTVMIGGAGYSAGPLRFCSFTQLGSAAINLTLTGTASLEFRYANSNSTFGGAFTATAPDISVQGGTFNGAASFTKTGGSSNHNNGFQNFFNSTLAINQQSNAGYFMLGYNSNDLFADNITVSSTGTGGIYLGFSSGTGTPTLSAGKTILVGGAGFSAGFLYLGTFTQLGSAAVNLNFTGTGALTFARSCLFGGNITAVVPSIIVSASTFNGTFDVTKTGSSSDASAGGNTFNATTSFSNSGSGYILLGNVTGDVFNADVTFSNSGSERILPAYNSTGNMFNGNITVNSTGSSVGINFCGTTAASATLAATKTISVGATGYTSGYLILQRFTQLGSAAVTLSMSSTAGYLQYGPSSAFGGNVTSTSPGLFFNGCTFSGTTTCTKTGSTSDNSSGNNVFTGVSSMNNSGSGYLLFGNGTRDQWLTDVTFNNTGSNIIYVAYNSTNNALGGNVTFNNNGSTGSGSGIRMMEAANATATISGNLTITNNPTSGTNNGIRICEGNSTSLTVSGTTSITNTNVNTSNYIRFVQGTSSSVTFQGAVTATNNGTSGSTNVIHFAFTGSTTFNGNVTLTSTGGTGIYFGANTGTTTMADNRTINTSSFTGGNLSLRNFTQSGPTTGNASSVSISGTNMLLSFNNCSFYDNVTGASQQIDCITSTFRGNASLTKISGNANNYWTGGNTFNGTTTITNQSTFILGMANGTADTYNGNVSFVQSSTGALSPNFNANCTYAGDISVTSPTGVAMTFGSSSSGVATMSGGNAQAISLVSGSVPVFTRLTINKSANNLTLNTRINISTTLTLTNGLINTTATNIVNMNNAAATTVGNSASYINGPMNYDMALSGTRTLNFPVGAGGDWRPVELTAVHNAATSYTYLCSLAVASAKNLGWTLPSTVTHVSDVHYWDIARSVTNGASSNANLSGNQTIKLYYDGNDGVTDPTYLTICKNTPSGLTTWVDIGGTGASAGTGSVTSTSSPTAFTTFSRFTLGNKISGTNPLPVELLDFTATPLKDEVQLDWSTASEKNNDYFMVERSADGVLFEPVKKVFAYGNGNSVVLQQYSTVDEQPINGFSYYRLLQQDKSGAYVYSNMVAVYFGSDAEVKVFPNPADEVVHIALNKETFETKGLKCMMYDNVGNLIKEFTPGNQQMVDVNLSNLSSGVYTLSIVSDKVIKTQKIVVRH